VWAQEAHRSPHGKRASWSVNQEKTIIDINLQIMQKKIAGFNELVSSKVMEEEKR